MGFFNREENLSSLDKKRRHYEEKEEKQLATLENSIKTVLLLLKESIEKEAIDKVFVTKELKHLESLFSQLAVLPGFSNAEDVMKRLSRESEEIKNYTNPQEFREGMESTLSQCATVHEALQQEVSFLEQAKNA